MIGNFQNILCYLGLHKWTPWKIIEIDKWIKFTDSREPKQFKIPGQERKCDNCKFTEQRDL